MQDGPNMAAGQIKDLHIGGVPLADIADCNGLRLRRVTRMMTSILDARLREIGLTSQQFSLLASIYGVMARGRALSMSALAELTGLDPTTLTRTLLPLKTAGWVTDSRADDDRRRRKIELTASGQARLAEGARQWQLANKTVQDRLGQTLSTEIRTTLNEAIGRLGAD